MVASPVLVNQESVSQSKRVSKQVLDAREYRLPVVYEFPGLLFHIKSIPISHIVYAVVRQIFSRYSIIAYKFGFSTNFLFLGKFSFRQMVCQCLFHLFRLLFEYVPLVPEALNENLYRVFKPVRLLTSLVGYDKWPFNLKETSRLMLTIYSTSLSKVRNTREQIPPKMFAQTPTGNHLQSIKAKG